MLFLCFFMFLGDYSFSFSFFRTPCGVCGERGNKKIEKSNKFFLLEIHLTEIYSESERKRGRCVASVEGAGGRGEGKE
jgi:hypothetical protein